MYCGRPRSDGRKQAIGEESEHGMFCNLNSGQLIGGKKYKPEPVSSLLLPLSRSLWCHWILVALWMHRNGGTASFTVLSEAEGNYTSSIRLD